MYWTHTSQLVFKLLACILEIFIANIVLEVIVDLIQEFREKNNSWFTIASKDCQGAVAEADG